MTANPLQPIPSIGSPPPPGANVGGSISRFSPIDPLRIIRQYIWFLVAATVLGLGSGFGYFAYLKAFKSQYTTSSRILVLAGVADGYASPERVMMDQAQEINTFIRNQLPRLTSEEVLGDVLKLEAVRRTRWYQSFDGPREARRELQKNLSASPLRGTSLLRVALSGSSQNDLPVILDQTVDIFLERVRADIDLRTTDVRRTFQREADSARQTLRQIDEQVKRFKIEHDIGTSIVQQSDDAKIYADLTRLLSILEIDIQQQRDVYNSLVAARDRARFAHSSADLAAVEADPLITEKTGQIRLLREEWITLSQKFGDRHPRIASIQESIRQLEQQKAMEIERLLRVRQTVMVENAKNELDKLQFQFESLHVKMFEVRTRLRDLEGKLEQMRQLEAGAAAARKRQERAESLLEDMRVRSIRPDAMRISVLTRADDASLTFPYVGSVVPGITMIFVGVAAALVFLKELLDQRIKSPQDIRLLPNAELLGVIPDSSEDPSSPKQFHGAVRLDPNGLLAESFRQLRTALLSRMDRRGYKSLMLVGAQGGGGVSAVLSNLAVSLAHNGRKVLILDANFRRPNQHTIFAIADRPGLYEVLMKRATLEQALAHIEGLTLDVLPTGDARLAPPEILEGAACRSLLSDLESQYDLLLIDAPPGLVASECQLLAKHVDAVAVVVRANSEKRGMVGRMLRQLDGYRADVLGLVFNGVRAAAGGYFRKAYRDFYNYRQTPVQPEAKSDQTTTAA